MSFDSWLDSSRKMGPAASFAAPETLASKSIFRRSFSASSTSRVTSSILTPFLKIVSFTSCSPVEVKVFVTFTPSSLVPSSKLQTYL